MTFTPPITALENSSATPFGLIEGTHWIESLRDGTRVLIRPLQPEDREREKAFINRLSSEALRHRFLGSFREVSATLLDQLMLVDFRHQAAFVALAHDNGKLREVGISRYCSTDDDEHCECAVTVAGDWTQRGLGVVLMRHLIDLARRNGYKQMFSLDAADNEAMRDLASYLGFQRKQDPLDATQVIHTLDL